MQILEKWEAAFFSRERSQARSGDKGRGWKQQGHFFWKKMLRRSGQLRLEKWDEGCLMKMFRGRGKRGCWLPAVNCTGEDVRMEG